MNLGFCPHKNLKIGLDAHYCPDCHKRFESGTKAYEELLTETDKRDLDKKKDAEISRLRKEIDGLHQENDELYKTLGALRTRINRAKNMNPFKRPSFLQVLQLARMAYMDIKREAGGWLLSMGSTITRKFKTLREIWELLTADDWYLGDIFPQTSADKPEPIPVEVRPKLPQRHPPLVPSMNASTTALWRYEDECLQYQLESS